MALKDMVDYIQEEVHKEVEGQINQAKIQATQSLISLGEELERREEEKLYHITTQLTKREQMLKAEQDFIFSTKNLKSENEFTEQLLQDFKASLLAYTKQQDTLYRKIMSSWIKKADDALQVDYFNIITCNDDVDMFQQIVLLLSINVSVEGSSKITAGFIAQSDGGITVDLSFETLFKERKQQLLNISMQMLKEDL